MSEKYEKLGKFLQKATTERSKEKKIDIKIVRASELSDIEYVKTGVDIFDTLVGGFPRGQFSLVFGGPSVGKTTFMLKTCGYVTDNAGSSVIMEPENRADKKWWSKFLDLNKVFVSQATGLGACLDNAVKIIKSGLVDIIFIDSLAALAVKELEKKGTEGDHMALVARRLPTFFNMATEIVAETKTAVVFIHQKRDVLDMFSSDIETYPGGNMLKHMVSVVLNMRRASTSKEFDKGERLKGPNGIKLGFMNNTRVIKNSTGTLPEGKALQLDFMDGKGVMLVPSIVYYALRNKVIVKDGPGKYVFEDGAGKYQQTGINNVILDVDNQPELRQRMLNKCKDYALDNMVDYVDEITPDVDFEKEVSEFTSNTVEEKKDESIQGEETNKEETAKPKADSGK